MTARPPGGLRRIRVTLTHTRTGAVTHDEHLRAEAATACSWLPFADVVLARRGDLGALGAHPGALVVAVPAEGCCWLRLGTQGRRTTLRLVPATPVPTAHWATYASLAHAWLVATSTSPQAGVESPELCGIGHGSGRRAARGARNITTVKIGDLAKGFGLHVHSRSCDATSFRPPGLPPDGQSGTNREVLNMSITIKPVKKPAMSKVAGAVLCG